jgi:two-component system, NarL family, invasion response regulator UvrY
MIKVGIVDDHSIVRSGLRKIIDERTDMEVLCEANGYSQLFEQLKSMRPDVILLDISMPERSGLEVLKELKQLYSSVRILVLSMYPENQFSVRTIKAGASGYITKESATELLVTAIRQIHSGRRFISPTVAEHMVNSLENAENESDHERLSAREFQILRMIAAGKKSPATIATYRARIMEKMNLKSNVELANYVVRHNLVE